MNIGIRRRKNEKLKGLKAEQQDSQTARLQDNEISKPLGCPAVSLLAINTKTSINNFKQPET